MTRGQRTRLQDRADIKSYIDRLLQSESGMAAHPLRRIICEMDSLHTSMAFAAEDMESLRGKAASMPNCMEKGYALRAAKQAAESLSEAQARFANAESLIETGVTGALEKVRNGSSVLKRPFSLPGIMAELKEITAGMGTLERTVRERIGEIEKSSGMRCENGHYIRAGGETLHGGTAGEDDLRGILWSMQGLVMTTGQAYRAAQAACQRVTEARQVRTSGRRQRSLPVKTACAGEEKPSLREKLGAARIASSEQYAMCRQQGKKECGRDIF